MSPATLVFMWCGRGEKKWQQQRKDNNNVFLSFLNASQENFSCLFSHFRFSCSSNRQEEEGYVIGTWTVTGRVKTTKQIWHWKSHEIPIFSTPIFLHFLLEKFLFFFCCHVELTRPSEMIKNFEFSFSIPFLDDGQGENERASAPSKRLYLPSSRCEMVLSSSTAVFCANFRLPSSFLGLRLFTVRQENNKNYIFVCDTFRVSARCCLMALADLLRRILGRSTFICCTNFISFGSFVMPLNLKFVHLASGEAAVLEFAHRSLTHLCIHIDVHTMKIPAKQLNWNYYYYFPISVALFKLNNKNSFSSPWTPKHLSQSFVPPSRHISCFIKCCYTNTHTHKHLNSLGKLKSDYYIFFMHKKRESVGRVCKIGSRALAHTARENLELEIFSVFPDVCRWTLCWAPQVSLAGTACFLSRLRAVLANGEHENTIHKCI